MEDFAVGGREHAQTPEGARGRGLGLPRGVACLEKGPGAGWGGDPRGQQSLEQKRVPKDSGADRRTEAGQDSESRRGSSEGPLGTEGRSWRGPRRGRGRGRGRAERLPTLRRSAAVHRVAKSMETCALPAPRPERLPPAAAPLWSGPLGARPDGGSLQDGAGACTWPL